MSDLRDCIEQSLLLGVNVGGLFYGSSKLLVFGFLQQLNTTIMTPFCMQFETKGGWVI